LHAVFKGTLDPALAGVVLATVSAVGAGPEEGLCSLPVSGGPGGGGRRRVGGVVLVIDVSVPAYGMGRVSMTCTVGKERKKLTWKTPAVTASPRTRSLGRKGAYAGT